MPTAKSHRAEATLLEDGAITLRDLPFRRAESVEVILTPFAAPPNVTRHPLWGTPVELIDPMFPVAEEDWDALQ
jgi:hypothetical protein